MTLNGLAADTTKKMMKPIPKAPRFNSVELLIGIDTLMFLTLLYEAVAVGSVQQAVHRHRYSVSFLSHAGFDPMPHRERPGIPNR